MVWKEAGLIVWVRAGCVEWDELGGTFQLLVGT